MIENIRMTEITTIESQLLNIDNTGNNNCLTRDQCFELYRNWSFGKRIVEALPTYAMSVPREIVFTDAPDEVADRFKKVSKVLRQDDMIKRALIYTRVCGIGALFVAVKNDDFPLINNLTVDDVQKNGIDFYALDSYTLTNNQFSQNPTKRKFQKPISYHIQGKKVADKRMLVMNNGEPVYLKYTTSGFNYSGTSVFQNLTPLIKSHIVSVIALRRISGKAGGIVMSNDLDARASDGVLNAIEKSKGKVLEMDNTGIMSMNIRDNVAFFPMQAVGELERLMNTIKYEIMIGVSDTPKSLLLDESLVNGMAEGKNDFSLALLAVNAFREKMLTPLYDFTDKYVMMSAFDDRFIQGIQRKYKRYEGLEISQIRDIWSMDMQYEFGNLIPEPDSLIQEREARTLEKLQRAKEIGADTESLQKEINDADIFKNYIVLNETSSVIDDLVGGDDERIRPTTRIR